MAVLLVAGLSVAGALVHVPGRGRRGPQPGQSGGGGGGAASEQGSFPPIAVVSVRELTQDGNEPNDNVSELPNVIANSPGKYWASDIYKSADFGGSGGFGLVLQLDGATSIAPVGGEHADGRLERRGLHGRFRPRHSRRVGPASFTPNLH